MSIAYALSESTVGLLALAAADGRSGVLEQARTLVRMYTNAIQRILGITPGKLVLMDEDALLAWFE